MRRLSGIPPVYDRKEEQRWYERERTIYAENSRGVVWSAALLCPVGKRFSLH